jgi:hypothetical protein
LDQSIVSNIYLKEKVKQLIGANSVAEVAKGTGAVVKEEALSI